MPHTCKWHPKPWDKYLIKANFKWTNSSIRCFVFKKVLFQTKLQIISYVIDLRNRPSCLICCWCMYVFTGIHWVLLCALNVFSFFLFFLTISTSDKSWLSFILAYFILCLWMSGYKLGGMVYMFVLKSVFIAYSLANLSTFNGIFEQILNLFANNWLKIFTV